jgi:undecaprenyl-diphosphatase
MSTKSPMQTPQNSESKSVSIKSRVQQFIQSLPWVDRRELSVFVVLFSLLASTWFFIELVDDVLEGDTMDFDRTLLLSMRTPSDLSDPIGPLWVEEIGRDITALGGNAILTLLTLAAVGFLILDGKRRVALILIMATLGALSVSTFLKHYIDRDRPNLVPHGAFPAATPCSRQARISLWPRC